MGIKLFFWEQRPKDLSRQATYERGGRCSCHLLAVLIKLSGQETDASAALDDSAFAQKAANLRGRLETNIEVQRWRKFALRQRGGQCRPHGVV